MRRVLLAVLMLVALAVPAGTQAGATYDIVYVRSPRHGDTQPARMADVFRPLSRIPGTSRC